MQHAEGKGVAVLRASVIKADGRVIDLGVIDATKPRWYEIKRRLALRALKKLGA